MGTFIIPVDRTLSTHAVCIQIDGMAKPSLTADILEAKPSRTPEEDFSYRWLTATIYAGM